MGVGAHKIQTTVYKINKPQGCYIAEYSQYFIVTINSI